MFTKTAACSQHGLSSTLILKYSPPLFVFFYVPGNHGEVEVVHTGSICRQPRVCAWFHLLQQNNPPVFRAHLALKAQSVLLKVVGNI